MFLETVTSQVRYDLFNWKYQTTVNGALDFSVSNLKEQKYGWRFLRLKASNKCRSDVFTGSKGLKKLLLINLAVKMPEEQYR